MLKFFTYRYPEFVLEEALEVKVLLIGIEVDCCRSVGQ